MMNRLYLIQRKWFLLYGSSSFLCKYVMNDGRQCLIKWRSTKIKLESFSVFLHSFAIKTSFWTSFTSGIIVSIVFLYILHPFPPFDCWFCFGVDGWWFSELSSMSFFLSFIIVCVFDSFLYILLYIDTFLLWLVIWRSQSPFPLNFLPLSVFSCCLWVLYINSCFLLLFYTRYLWIILIFTPVTKL